MNQNKQEFDWSELRDIWENSSKTYQINIKMPSLINELKSKVSQFEKDSIKIDVATLKINWEKFKGGVSQFEKDSVSKDMTQITRLLKNS